MRIADDDAIILQPNDALGFSKLHIEHLPLPQQRAVCVVDEHAPCGVHHGKFVMRPGREAARSRLHRAIGGEHPCAAGLHGDRRSATVAFAACGEKCGQRETQDRAKQRSQSHACAARGRFARTMNECPRAAVIRLQIRLRV